MLLPPAGLPGEGTSPLVTNVNRKGAILFYLVSADIFRMANGFVVAERVKSSSEPFDNKFDGQSHAASMEASGSTTASIHPAACAVTAAAGLHLRPDCIPREAITRVRTTQISTASRHAGLNAGQNRAIGLSN
jgi:hypothetical protein